MDWLTFFVEIVKVLVWPTALVLAALLFRKPLAELIPALRHLRYKELELDFEQILRETEQQAGTMQPPSKVAIETQPALPPHLEQIVDLAPVAAVLEASRDLEAAAVAAGAERGISVAGGMWQVFLALQNAGVLSATDTAIAQRLYDLRNRIAHAPEEVITPKIARRYIAIAQKLAETLRTARRPSS